LINSFYTVLELKINLTILSLAIIIGEYGDDRVNCDNLSELINRNEIPAIAIKISIKILEKYI